MVMMTRSSCNEGASDWSTSGAQVERSAAAKVQFLLQCSSCSTPYRVSKLEWSKRTPPWGDQFNPCRHAHVDIQPQTLTSPARTRNSRRGNDLLTLSRTVTPKLCRRSPDALPRAVIDGGSLPVRRLTALVTRYPRPNVVGLRAAFDNKNNRARSHAVIYDHVLVTNHAEMAVGCENALHG